MSRAPVAGDRGCRKTCDIRLPHPATGHLSPSPTSTDSVTLLLSNRSSSTIPPSKLSQADQDHVATWLAKRIPDLRFNPNIVRSNKKKYSSSTQQVQTYDMSVTVRNDENNKGLEKSLLKYILVGHSLKNASEFKILSVQEAEFTVDPAGNTTIPFRKVINEYYEGRSSSSSYSSGYKCIGYVLHAVRLNDKAEVYAHASTNQLKANIQSIALLKTGDLTTKYFGNPWAVKKGPEGEDPNAPIIVR